MQEFFASEHNYPVIAFAGQTRPQLPIPAPQDALCSILSARSVSLVQIYALAGSPGR